MNNITTVQVLTWTRQTIEQGWTQAAFARDAQGQAVPSNHPNAVCWCLAGALCANVPDSELRDPARRALTHALMARNCFDGYVSFNDKPGTTQADVLALIDEAIAWENML